jgi:uncharacterized protein YerC
MTGSNKANAISLTITQFPQNLLIPNIDNTVSLEVINNLDKQADYKFEFKGENINIVVLPQEFNDNIKLNANETRKIELKLTPKVDGYGKLIINVYWLKIIKYTEKVQKIRTTISHSILKKILAKNEILNSKTVASFNHNEFMMEPSKNGIKKAEKELELLQERYNQQRNANQKNGSITVNQIDALYKDLAKSYLAIGDVYKALENALKLSNQEAQTQFYYDLIRVYAFKNLEQGLQIIKNLNDEKKRNLVLSEIALDYVDINSEQILKVLSLINDPSIRDQAIVNVVSKCYTNQMEFALKLSDMINEELSKIKVLFNLIKELSKLKRNDQILQIVKTIHQMIKNSTQINIAENQFKNPTYSFFKDVVCIIAELDSPETADMIIKSSGDKETQDGLTKDLFDLIYEMVDEVKTRVEPKVLQSQFYTLNTCVSQLSNELQQFSLLGGNTSSNALMKQFDFRVLFLSLFSLNFSIFPFLDRVYNDLLHNSKKSIGYYVYPSINNLDQEELAVIQRTLKQFFPVNNLKKDLVIFNLDFIPYLGKPTVIFASSSRTLAIIKSKVEKKLGEQATVLIDEGIFKGGASLEPITNTLGAMGADIVNLVLSYEFLNDYNLFKIFIESLF